MSAGCQPGIGDRVAQRPGAQRARGLAGAAHVGRLPHADDGVFVAQVARRGDVGVPWDIGWQRHLRFPLRPCALRSVQAGREAMLRQETVQNLGVCQAIGPRRRIGRAQRRWDCQGHSLFSPRFWTVSPAIEELDAAVIGLEGAECQAAITQAKQIAAHLFLAQQIRRAPIVSGEAANCVEVDGLGSRSQPRQRHVFGHPQVQRCH